MKKTSIVKRIVKLIVLAVLMELIIGIVFIFIGHALSPAPIDRTQISLGLIDEELVWTADKVTVKAGDITCEEQIDNLAFYFYWNIPTDKVDIFKSNELKSVDIIFTDSDSKEVRVVENVAVENKSPFKEMYSIEIYEYHAEVKYDYRTDYMMYICMGVALVVYLVIIFVRYRKPDEDSSVCDNDA